MKKKYENCSIKERGKTNRKETLVGTQHL